LFNAIFRNEGNVVSKSSVKRTIQRFEKTGIVKNHPKSKRPATNPEKSLVVLQSFVEDPHTSIGNVAQEHQINLMSVHKILKQNKFHSFKVRLVHELNENDFDRRVEFCEIMMTRIDTDPDFLFKIIFSKEMTFQLDNTLNRVHTTLLYLTIVDIDLIQILTGCEKIIPNMRRS